MRKLSNAALVAGALLVALTQPVAAQRASTSPTGPDDGAAAAVPAAITIETVRQGPFGSFESAGALADSGTFAVQSPVFGGPGPGRFVNVHATETFTGVDGTFTLARTLRVTWGDDPAVRAIDGYWAVIAGTGAYEDLRAHGTISGTVAGVPPAEVFVLTYRGSAGG